MLFLYKSYAAHQLSDRRKRKSRQDSKIINLSLSYHSKARAVAAAATACNTGAQNASPSISGKRNCTQAVTIEFSLITDLVVN